MKKYTNIDDISNLEDTIQQAIELKKAPFSWENLGKHKTLVMLFFNASLRTRLSTEKAANNLGVKVMVLNVNDAWNLEFEDWYGNGRKYNRTCEGCCSSNFSIRRHYCC